MYFCIGSLEDFLPNGRILPPRCRGPCSCTTWKPVKALATQRFLGNKSTSAAARGARHHHCLCKRKWPQKCRFQKCPQKKMPLKNTDSNDINQPYNIYPPRKKKQGPANSTQKKLDAGHPKSPKQPYFDACISLSIDIFYTTQLLQLQQTIFTRGTRDNFYTKHLLH